MPSLAPPSLHTCKVLLAQEDPRLLEMMVEAIVGQFDAHLTCVSSGEDALDIEMVEPHDIVVADTDLPGIDGLTLTRHLMELCDRPVILVAEEPPASHVIEAMRLRAWDLFPKPFGLDDLLDSMRRALDHRRQTYAATKKYRRLRHLVRHVLRERRDLNQRIELICRDLVGAHRRLVHRVLEHQGPTQAKA